MNKLKTIIFWGALWGILEASLGWVLHLIHFKGRGVASLSLRVAMYDDGSQANRRNGNHC